MAVAPNVSPTITSIQSVLPVQVLLYVHQIPSMMVYHVCYVLQDVPYVLITHHVLAVNSAIPISMVSVSAIHKMVCFIVLKPRLAINAVTIILLPIQSISLLIVLPAPSAPTIPQLASNV